MRKEKGIKIHEAGFYLGRTYEDLLVISEDERGWVIEVDMVCGRARELEHILFLYREGI